MEYCICFDIGGTRIKMGVLSEGKLIHHDLISIEDNTSLKAILKLIEGHVNSIVKSHNTGEQLLGIGISLPSLIDSDNNKVLSRYVKYTDAGEIDLNKWSMQNFGVPIFLENDAKAALMGEVFYGAGRGYQDIVLVTFGTGVGSAVMLNGKLLKGKDFLAGNLIGHSIIDYDGGLCNCGGSGCVESVASSWSLPEKIKTLEKHKKTPTEVDYKYLFEASKRGEKEYSEILEDSLKAWGKMIINLVLAYNPECIVCAGGIMNEGEYILNSFRKSLDQHGWISSANVELIPAENTDFAALFGLHEIINQNKEKKKV
jgi:glucokinase